MRKEAESDSSLPVPFYPAYMMAEENLFSRALKRIQSETVLQQLQSEFAGLCNQIIVADQERIKTKEELKIAVKKACGYLTIGLRQLTAGTDAADVSAAVEWIQSFPLSGIFRIGFGLALTLKWRAEKWQRNAWFEQAGLPLSFWGEEWLGVLGGLLIKKPLFYDNYRSGTLYREFASLEDIRKTEAVLNEIIAFDELLSLMAIQITERSYRFMTQKSLILTLWTRHRLGLSEGPVPLTINEFKQFFDDLFITDNGPDIHKPRKTRVSLKEELMQWLSEKSGLSPFEISRSLGKTLESLFLEIESELGSVAKEDLHPRYIHLFLVQ